MAERSHHATCSRIDALFRRDLVHLPLPSPGVWEYFAVLDTVKDDLYVETNLQAAEFADKLARRTLGRAPAQVLLLHETDLATLYLPDLARALRANGWTIITADEAYADPMGKLPPPVIADANGTLIQMLSWEHGTKGPRWFERNEIKEADRLFNERVLHRQ